MLFFIQAVFLCEWKPKKYEVKWIRRTGSLPCDWDNSGSEKSSLDVRSSDSSERLMDNELLIGIRLNTVAQPRIS